ncbi:MAG: JAB domain-containing protein [Myxococcaceae bacterium]
MEGLGSVEGEVRFAVSEALAGEPEWIERVFVQGATALSEAELQLVLTGKKGPLDLRTLRQMDPHELAKHFGHRGAARICAALELVRRTMEPPPREPLTFAQDIYRYVWPKLAGAPRETLMVLCLDPRNHLLRETVASQGSSDGCPVDPREVFAPAMSSRATSIVLAHNHPSGDPEPSVADWVLTRQLAEGAETLKVKLADHIVLSERGFVSMQSRGLLGSKNPFQNRGRDGG